MPNVLDLIIYLRDLLLYAIAKGVYGNSYFSGSASIITAFRDLVTEAENGANGLQKNINHAKSRMQLLDRGNMEGRSECINMIAQCENAKLDLENQNIVLQDRLNAGKHAASGKVAAGTVSSSMKELDYSDKYMQERRAVASRYANLDNFENPEVSKFLTSKRNFTGKRRPLKGQGLWRALSQAQARECFLEHMAQRCSESSGE